MCTPLPPPRFVLIITRWVTILAYGSIAGAVVFVCEPLLRHVGEPFVHRLSAIPALALGTILTITIGALCCFSGAGRWRGFVGFRFAHLYPPLSLSILVGGATWFAFVALDGRTQEAELLLSSSLWFLLGLPTSLGLALCLLCLAAVVAAFAPPMRWSSSIANKKERDSTTSLLDIDFSALQKWISDDTEIDLPTSDLFGHNLVAERIASQLTNKSEAPTIALIGSPGSGKSSIGQLVRFHLRAASHVKVIQVSLWPFDSPDAAVRGVLHSLVRELGRHVNILGVAGLSEEYVSAIEKTAGSYGGIARLLRKASDPQDIIGRLSDIACATGLRLVLWIEDLERFSGGDQLDPSARAEREAERLGPIRALLHLLDRCPQISVIVVDTSLRTRFDLSKIARLVEQPPALEREHVSRIISLFRTACLGSYPRGVIDPGKPHRSETFDDDIKGRFIAEWLQELDQSPISLTTAMIQVLRTPRSLKFALRVTLDAWERLAGEVDLDSVLVASTIRTAFPELFDVLVENSRLFQHGFANPLQSEKQAAEEHPVAKRVEQVLSGRDEFTSRAFVRLLNFIFPTYPPRKKIDDGYSLKAPQSFVGASHTNYWRRYLTQTPVLEAESDQNALEAIAAWCSDQDSDLVDRLLDASRSDQIENFVGQFSRTNLCALLTQVAEKVEHESAENWERGTHAPGVVPIWRMMLRKRPREGELCNTIKELVHRFASVHLPLMNEVLHFFVFTQGEVPRLLSKEHVVEVRKALEEVFSTAFTGPNGSKNLQTALRGGSLWLVLWFTNYLRFGKRQNEFPLSNWAQFADALLQLAIDTPRVGISLIASLLCTGELKRHDRRDDEDNPFVVEKWEVIFDEAKARRLFNFERLKEILAQTEMPLDVDGQIGDFAQAAVEAARRQDNPKVA